MTQPGPAFLRGIVPSMNTPFLDDGSVDLAGIRRSVDAVVQAGVAGMLILAVAAETASLTLTEKRLVAQTFLAQTAGRIPVIIGCSSAEQADRVALAAMAREFGAQIMLCQAPAGLGGEALVAQMAALAQVGPPMLMVQDLDFGGPGLPLDDILLLRQQLPAFQCLKIEVALPGPKYSAVLAATQGTLHVSGGGRLGCRANARSPAPGRARLHPHRHGPDLRGDLPALSSQRHSRRPRPARAAEPQYWPFPTSTSTPASASSSTCATAKVCSPHRCAEPVCGRWMPIKCANLNSTLIACWRCSKTFAFKNR